MAEYNPSFVFQSKILSSNVSNNDNPQSVSQADQQNTIGTVNDSRIDSVVSPQYNLVSFDETTPSAIKKGGGLTREDTYGSKSFQCSVILEAAAFLCTTGPLPDCESPKERAPSVNSPTDNVGGKNVSINCICVDNSQNDQSGPTDDDIDTMVGNAADCLRQAREDALSRKLNQADIDARIDALGSPDSVVDSVLKDVGKALKEILQDSNLSMAEKAEQAAWLLERTKDAIALGEFPTNPGFENDVDDITGSIGDAASSVDDDCALNSVPGPGAIRAVINNLSKKPAKV
jgi:hypothetical protein